MCDLKSVLVSSTYQAAIHTVVHAADFTLHIMHIGVLVRACTHNVPAAGKC